MTKRIQVPVTPELEKAISDFAAVTNSSNAAVCASLLAEVAPTLVEMTKAMMLVKQAPAAAARSMASIVESKVAEANQFSLDMEKKYSPKKTG
jgi:hypothetical protein